MILAAPAGYFGGGAQGSLAAPPPVHERLHVPSSRPPLRGVVVDFKLRSPHSSFVINARTFADGQQGASAERWEIESEALPVLRTMPMTVRTSIRRLSICSTFD